MGALAETAGREMIASNGKRVRAVNSWERNFTEAKLARAMAESDKRLVLRYLKWLDDADTNEKDGPKGRTVEKLQERIAAIRERCERLEGPGRTLVKSGEDQISMSDPDARAMHFSSRVGVGYDIKTAVDTKHKLIAASSGLRPAKLPVLCPAFPSRSVDRPLPKGSSLKTSSGLTPKPTTCDPYLRD